MAQNYQQRLTERSRKAYYNSDTVKKWLDWNILFNEKASAQDKNTFINNLETSIDKKIAVYNSSTRKHFRVDYHVVYCPCDSLLTNLNATRALGATGSVTPPTPPGTHGSGDTVSQNLPIDKDPPLGEGKDILNIVE
ncbi:MAG TPA: hypothetical protein VKI61_15605, partial [Chitinophagaceae bacterium]|nr:hypothetical protein [Chitinophagaceae bacterium]